MTASRVPCRTPPSPGFGREGDSHAAHGPSRGAERQLRRRRVREDFPILAMQVHGKPLVYLDNAASAQKPKAVLDRLDQAYTTEYANVHRGLHYSRQRGDRSATRPRATRSRNSSMPDAAEEIIFTRGATEAINLVAQTFGRERIRPGDEIVLSIMEHHANIVPWHFLRERQGRGAQVGAGRRRRQLPASRNSRSC